MAEVEVAVAPAELIECLEAVRLHRGRHLVGQRRAWPVVPNVPSRMPRPARPAIWATSAGAEPARAMAVELPQAGEGDMVHVHVQAHADRVGGDQEVDLLVLVERHLSVAGAWADSRPITTAQPPRRRRISSAMA